MTITFPRAMPLVGPGQQSMEPVQVGYQTPETGGALYGITAGNKRWRGEWTLAQAMQDIQSDEWRAWIDSLNGPTRRFYGQDYERPFPRLYKLGFGGLTRAGGGAFDGSLTSWSQTITTPTDPSEAQALLTLNGLPAGFQLSVGDYCDFRWTTSGVARRSLVRSLENATANGSGVIANVSVSPPIPTVTPGGAVAHLDNPACVMRLKSDECSVTPMDRRRVVGAKIVAIQDIRP